MNNTPDKIMLNGTEYTRRPVVVVKQLEWEEYPKGTWKARTTFGSEYTVTQDGDTFWLGGRVVRKRFGSLDDAQNHAQSDFAIRLKECLE